MRSSPYRVVRGYLSGTALVALPLVIALSPAASLATPAGGTTELMAFNSDQALTRAELDRLRGGFFLPNGNMINFGISVQQYVNNQLANSVSLRVDNNFTLTQTGPNGTQSFFSTPQGGINSMSFAPSKLGSISGSFTPPSGGNSPPSPNNLSGGPNGVTNTSNTNNTPNLGTPSAGNTNLVTTNTQTPNIILKSGPTTLTVTPTGFSTTLSTVTNGGLTNLGVTINNGAIQSVIQNAANNQALTSIATLNLTTQGFASTLHNVVTMSNIAGVIQSNALLMHH